MTDIDVIVLDIDGGEMLQACLASIAAQTQAARRVVVFDNGSRIPTPNAIRSEVNLGFAGGVNAAMKHGDAPYVALVNNDVVLDADWLATVAAALDADPKLAAVQTVIRRDDDTLDGVGIDISDGTIRQAGHGGPQVPPASGRLSRRPPAAAGGETPPLQPARGRRHPWGVSATAALYRRPLLHFDERFFAYYEDAELSARLLAGGWKLAVLPVAKATHRGSQSASILGGDALRLRTRNRYWVARLHPGTARISSLLWEDVKLALRGRTSLRGIMQGIFGKL
jgi:GT2 family glycosyltransferase